MADKVWLITGCSSGLGRALAEHVLERGGRVAATARDAGALAGLAALWPETCLTLNLDVTDPEQVRAAVAECVRVFGRLDVLINNAGYGLVGAVEEVSEAQIRRNFEVNFFGALAVVRAALPYFREAKSGHIVNISAAAAISNYPGFGIYGAAKCALEGLSESLAAEGRAFGVKVTVVQPGPFRTDFISRSLEHAETALPAYEGSAGKFGKFIAGMDGKQPGDPVLAARAICEAVDAERPPLRLVLGKYACEKVRRGLGQRESELKTWEAVGLSADGPAGG
jgi:NAD(P)-dependent dehydrogenase (short-subunit alcohol dehydrogenase family)